MKHTKIFAFALAAILLATALCACQSPSPDPADTTPAPPLSDVVDTTPTETTPTETTPAETTPNETTTNESPYPFPEIEPMPDELREKVEKAFVENTIWKDLTNEFPGWTTADAVQKRSGVRYYGMFGDVVILFHSASILQAVETKSISGESFMHFHPFDLYAYHNGVLIDLADAYEQGIISAEDISKAAQIHEQFHMWAYYS